MDTYRYNPYPSWRGGQWGHHRGESQGTVGQTCWRAIPAPPATLVAAHAAVS